MPFLTTILNVLVTIALTVVLVVGQGRALAACCSAATPAGRLRLG